MNRRQLLKTLVAGLATTVIDPEKLLWVPGEKKIFILNGIRRPTEAEILALEWERVIPQIRNLFERDSYFYSQIAKRDVEKISDRSMRIPLIIKPGE